MAEVSVEEYVNAPPDKLYELVRDVTRMGEWSPRDHVVPVAREGHRTGRRRPIPRQQSVRLAALVDHVHCGRGRSRAAVCVRRRCGTVARVPLGIPLRT